MRLSQIKQELQELHVVRARGTCFSTLVSLFCIIEKRHGDFRPRNFCCRGLTRALYMHELPRIQVSAHLLTNGVANYDLDRRRQL